MDLFPDLCLCLLILSGAAFSQQTGSKVTRKIIKEDQDALLECALDGINIKDEVFDWKKDGSTEVFFYSKGSHFGNGRLGQDPQFEDRVFLFPEQLVVGNASIVIRKAQVKDSGAYSCKFPFHEPQIRAEFELTVEWILKPRKIPGAVQKPYITIEKTSDGFLLQCEVERAFPKPRMEWLDSSGSSIPAEPKFTETDGIFEVFLQTTVTKSGKYRCVATQEEIHSQVYAETYMPVPGAASRPIIENLEETNDQALLQCEVVGVSPKPEVFWKDDSGNIIKSEEPEVTERGGSYDVVVRTTVTKTDYYHCVVTQDDINHQVSAKTHVVLGGSVSGFPIGWIVAAAVVGAVVVLVVVVIVFVVLQNKGYISCNKEFS